MFASFFANGKMRATQALVADKPEGPFRVFGKPLTPENWMCLDGTLYMENEKPYLVFCHEWVQTGDGEILAMPLKEDLSEASGEPRLLFKASESGWSQQIENRGRKGYVTDGPFLVKNENELTMFWSSFRDNHYAVGMAVSTSGSVFGPWKHLKRLLFERDGGHGMYFQGLNGRSYFALHKPNCCLEEHPCFFEIKKLKYGYELL